MTTTTTTTTAEQSNSNAHTAGLGMSGGIEMRSQNGGSSKSNRAIEPAMVVRKELLAKAASRAESCVTRMGHLWPGSDSRSVVPAWHGCALSVPTPAQVHRVATFADDNPGLSPIAGSSCVHVDPSPSRSPSKQSKACMSARVAGQVRGRV